MKLKAITINKESLKKEFIKNQKKINNKKTSKEERKELIKQNQDILYMLKAF